MVNRSRKPTAVTDGSRLRAYLENRPPSLAEIARASEPPVSRQFVWRVVNRRAKPTPAVIAGCRKLGLPVALLFGEEEER